MTATPPSPGKKATAARLFFAASLIGSGVLGVFALHQVFLAAPSPPKPPRILPDLSRSPSSTPLRLAAGRRLTVWWDTLPALTSSRSGDDPKESNIHPADYIGPEACGKCHPGKYQTWSAHPHRWMNALAGEGTVRGDFSGAATLSYRGGRAAFERRAGNYYMRLERGGVRRDYRVTQTIGSRFFQYYVGRLVEGPEPPGHHFYTRNHVLPFGYWLSQKEWVPVVHIGPEQPDAERADPFAPPESGRHYAEYATSCNYCHTTFPLGDLFSRRPQQMGEYAPVPLHWSMRGYLQTAHPEDLPTMARSLQAGDVVRNPMADWEASRYAVTLGVSCEACHLGGRTHARSKGQVPPEFFPSSPYLFVESRGTPLQRGRSHDNVNWACARCHVGGRPAFAAGMATWNSVEYSDAVRGHCYSRLRCIDCHNPHQAIGPAWSAPPDHDDAVCLRCHDQFRDAGPRRAHTHHPPGSEGAGCLNCHMPRINEGLQDVVRTHMIYSPTRADMIHANHPNACNLCHTDQPIDWTLRYLKEWYGRTYDPGKIAAHYPERDRPVALGWLHSPNESVRLVGADALMRARDTWALPALLEALDDPYLLNRQFAARGLQEMLDLRLRDSGYRFYQTREERRGPLAVLRGEVLDRAKRDRTEGPSFRP